MKTLAMILNVSLLTLSLQGCVILSDTTLKAKPMQLAEAGGVDSEVAQSESTEKVSTELMVEILRDVFVPIFTVLLTRG